MCSACHNKVAAAGHRQHLHLSTAAYPKPKVGQNKWAGDKIEREGGKLRERVCVRKSVACRRKTLRSLCLQTDIVNFVNFVNILMMTSLVRAEERGVETERDQELFF